MSHFYPRPWYEPRTFHTRSEYQHERKRNTYGVYVYAHIASRQTDTARVATDRDTEPITMTPEEASHIDNVGHAWEDVIRELSQRVRAQHQALQQARVVDAALHTQILKQHTAHDTIQHQSLREVCSQKWESFKNKNKRTNVRASRT